jgi:cyclopropane fatty-acyl-phospholipid synthase-like methyltransferase
MIISNFADFDSAWKEQYARVAKVIARKLPRAEDYIVEVGCGKGQLTVPLAQLVKNYHVVAVDNFAGAYSNHRRALRSAISLAKLTDRVSVVASDYMDWLTKQPRNKYPVVISSEFLPEINSNSMKQFFDQCYSVLRSGGVTVHSFLSPHARNSRQKLFIEADTDPRYAEYPPQEWFSPSPKFAISSLRKSGFRDIETKYLKSNLIINSKAAYSVLKDWDVKDAFFRTYVGRLESEGFEIPDWVIVVGHKANVRK